MAVNTLEYSSHQMVKVSNLIGNSKCLRSFRLRSTTGQISNWNYKSLFRLLRLAHTPPTATAQQPSAQQRFAIELSLRKTKLELHSKGDHYAAAVRAPYAGAWIKEGPLGEILMVEQIVDTGTEDKVTGKAVREIQVKDAV